MEQRLADLNMHDIEFELEEGQEQRPRRSLIPNDLLNEAISYIQSHIPKLRIFYRKIIKLYRIEKS